MAFEHCQKLRLIVSQVASNRHPGGEIEFTQRVDLALGVAIEDEKALATRISWAFPGVSSKTQGLPLTSQMAWSLVLRPPRVWPIPLAKAPLLRRLRCGGP